MKFIYGSLEFTPEEECVSWHSENKNNSKSKQTSLLEILVLKIVLKYVQITSLDITYLHRKDDGITLKHATHITSSD